ncbi:MAG: hypothetical protein IJ689_03140 [Alphaproteobacteria bacterium]|nr:hypothetical protein [Alphaproteobacteria bacterium]
MNISKKVLSATAILLATVNIHTAAAASDSAVLFKIHDISPIKNSEGEVVSCDYSATFYNRSDMTIRNATLDLNWKDTAIEGVIEQEKKEDAAKNNRSPARARSTTERNTDKNIGTLLEVPTIKPAKQVTVQSRVNTDRCFLLIENVDFKVQSCNAENAQGRGISGSAGKARSGGGACNSLFSYVSPEDPQYYLEFKAISVEDEKAEIEKQREKLQSENEELYNQTVTAIDAANTIVSGIK